MKQQNATCKRCDIDFTYEWTDTYWDENGSESTKLVKCPYCSRPVVVGYWKSHKWETNKDPRYYNYYTKDRE